MQATRIASIALELGSWSTLEPLASRVRTAVFVHEQGIPAELEWDAADASSLHCVARIDGETVGTGRLLRDGHIGRMAVLPAWRRAGLGGRILEALVTAAAERGHERVELSAQVTARSFYRRHGFEALGEVYDEVGIPHQRMQRALWGGEITTELGVAPSGARGAMLRTRRWRPARAHGGGLYLLHGLGEHAGRYDALARWLCARGWTVAAHDHLGHGESAGRRGVIDAASRLRDDAAVRLAEFAEALGRAPILMGHSMGGAMAAELAVADRAPVAGLVLSSPALAVPIAAPMRLLVRVLAQIAPDLTLGNGLDPARLSHDPQAVRAYLDDPRVHDRISPRLIAWLLRAGDRARAAAPGLAVPTLLLVAGADAMVDPAGSRVFAAAAPADRVALRLHEPLYHELFNERPEDRARVLGDLEAWLAGRAPISPQRS
jgi:alpha-beta hydrolase superfamily lysophospholipase/predicted GNAT family N-acyltransferase